MYCIIFVISETGEVFIDIVKEARIKKELWLIRNYNIMGKFSVAGKKCGEKEYLKRELSSLKEVLKENHLHGNWYKKDKLIDTIISSFCK